MNGEIIHGRLRTIFRILSVLTLLVGSIGFLIAANSIAIGPFSYQAVQYLEGQTHSRAGVLVYFVGTTGLLFNMALIYAGTLLWRLRRKGLSVLSYILVAEFIYVVVLTTAVMGSPLHPSHALSKGYGYILGVGVLPFAVQVLTAFPIIASALIFFAYRYLGITARPME